ncbi:MAG: Holliday junction resolvase RuvX [Pseudohongiellaceae bacterium]
MMEFFPSDPSREYSALAFDFGTQRIGVAYGQSLSGTAKALRILPARDGIPDWDSVDSLLDEWNPDVLVVGLPYNMDDSHSELQKRAEKFAARLHGRFHKPCFGMDERLSSEAAREQIAKNGEGFSRDVRIDSVAAQLILESWFAELRQRRQEARGAEGGKPGQP